MLIFIQDLFSKVQTLECLVLIPTYSAAIGPVVYICTDAVEKYHRLGEEALLIILMQLFQNLDKLKTRHLPDFS